MPEIKAKRKGYGLEAKTYAWRPRNVNGWLPLAVSQFGFRNSKANPDIPPRLEEIVSKCLDKDRNLRYQHASEIRADLQRLKRDTESGRAEVIPKSSSPWSRRMTLIGTMAFAFVILMIAGLWKTFSKAGQPGWAAIIPIYNLIVLCQVAGRPIWWFLLLLICFPIFYIIICINPLPVPHHQHLSVSIAYIAFSRGIGGGNIRCRD